MRRAPSNLALGRVVTSSVRVVAANNPICVALVHHGVRPAEQRNAMQACGGVPAGDEGARAPELKCAVAVRSLCRYLVRLRLLSQHKQNVRRAWPAQNFVWNHTTRCTKAGDGVVLIDGEASHLASAS
jgi:hypothetical protein